MEWVFLASARKWKSQNDYIAISRNENENVKMKMDSFHNENEMSPAGRGPQMTFAKWIRIHFKMSPGSFW